MISPTEQQAILTRAARLWLREGYTTPDKVKALHRLVSASRGTDYADRLRDEMRHQWRIRQESMQASTLSS